MSDLTERLSADFGRPYWAEGVIPARTTEGPVPKSADLVVVGAGYTGLNAALAAANAGQSVVVLDREAPGSSASGRNGGHVSTSMKPGLAELSKKVGPEKARAILSLGLEAVAHLDALIDREAIDCDYETCGHFTGAHKPSALEGLKAWADEQRDIGNPIDVVDRSDQRGYVGSDHFHGGVYMPRWKSLHPGKYVNALADRVARLAAVHGQQTVSGIEKRGSGATVRLASGNEIAARNVVIATNAQTGALSRDLRRRLMPIASVQIATEPLDPDLVAKLHPRRAMSYDSRRLVTYTRPSPDGRRVLLGGRVRFVPGRSASSRSEMHRRLAAFFPELAKTKTEFLWGGLVGYTFDHLPQIGSDGPIHYAMGYCGTGVAMASYMGARIGQRVSGEPGGEPTPLDGMPARSVPLYDGDPWFLPLAVGWYAMLDRFA